MTHTLYHSTRRTGADVLSPRTCRTVDSPSSYGVDTSGCPPTPLPIGTGDPIRIRWRKTGSRYTHRGAGHAYVWSASESKTSESLDAADGDDNRVRLVPPPLYVRTRRKGYRSIPTLFAIILISSTRRTEIASSRSVVNIARVTPHPPLQPHQSQLVQSLLVSHGRGIVLQPNICTLSTRCASVKRDLGWIAVADIGASSRGPQPEQPGQQRVQCGTDDFDFGDCMATAMTPTPSIALVSAVTCL
ncbi:hypothetical protein EXIGLDRAFT_474622 [Exidia glandulosa HHB12029]|uniref:Uncharacterized protein n=1 Tax=Exidia glandulosa HHB12029 TaxID=1314781 RepID=A0A165JVY1_EXIGL|nr:hypothetical protein EXIGLDRAFT_474622 [Exidia glandulosa HHB12029]